MKARSRNNVLILMCLAFFVALRFVTPDPAPERIAWSWDSVSEGPTDSLGLIGAEDFSPVRVLGSPDDIEARTAVELLWSAGLLGVRLGPPGRGEAASSEVWVLPGPGDCSLVSAALDHLRAGGRLVAWSPCPALVEGLGAPPALSYEGSPGQTAFVGASVESGPLPLPLPASGAEWPGAGEDGWDRGLSRAGGSPLLLSSDEATLLSIDWSGWVRSLRQGDPSFSGQDRDGLHGPKPNDLRPFPWAEPVWRTPGAELWTEVIVEEISRLAEREAAALPRIWPLPSAADSALVLTSDQDFGDPDWMDSMLARTEKRGGEMSLLSTAQTRQENNAAVDGAGGTFLSEGALSRARDWGHGVGLHPNPAGLGAPSAVKQAIRLAHQRMLALEGDRLRVVRNHYLLWWDYEAPIQLYAELGIWMELNFVSIAPGFGGPGFLFGSARPARFVGGQSTHPVLSQPTQIEDDVLVSSFPYSAKLSGADAVVASQRLMDSGLLHRVPITANLHPLWVVEDQGQLFDGLLDAATARGLPILSAERWATQSWDRLGRALETELRLEGRRWVVSSPPGSESSVPQWLWSPVGSSCLRTASPSALAAPGCLQPWPGAD